MCAVPHRGGGGAAGGSSTSLRGPEGRPAAPPHGCGDEQARDEQGSAVGEVDGWSPGDGWHRRCPRGSGQQRRTRGGIEVEGGGYVVGPAVALRERRHPPVVLDELQL